MPPAFVLSYDCFGYIGSFGVPLWLLEHPSIFGLFTPKKFKSISLSRS